VGHVSYLDYKVFLWPPDETIKEKIDGGETQEVHENCQLGWSVSRAIFEPGTSKLGSRRLMYYRCSNLFHKKLSRVLHAVLGVCTNCDLSFVLHRPSQYRWNYMLVCLAVCSPTRGKFIN
jgi:hypothetical protein